MKRLVRLTVIALTAFAISAPALAAPKPAPNPNWPASFSAYVGKVRKTIKTTNMDGYLAAVKNPNGAVLIDVREDAEYKAGHIPGTINLQRGLLEFQIWKALGYPKKVDMNKKIFVQCRTGGRATLATADLKKIGFKNVTAVIMNIDEWQKKGLPWTTMKK